MQLRQEDVSISAADEDETSEHAMDAVTIVDVYTGEIKVIEPSKDETLYFAEGLPQIAVLNGSMYFYVMNTDDGSDSLKVMNLDGSNISTLIKSDPIY